MANNQIECHVLPGWPLPLILPIESVAAIVAKPELRALPEAPASWMKGHVTWQNQNLPVLSYSALQNPGLDESKKRNPHLVVLNPIPDAARKAFAGLLCFGEVSQLLVDDNLEYDQYPEKVDHRYIQAVVKYGEQQYIIPKLTALGVAFSYL